MTDSSGMGLVYKNDVHRRPGGRGGPALESPTRLAWSDEGMSW